MENEFYLIKASDGSYYNGTGFMMIRESAPKLYMGWKAACQADAGLAEGLNMINGEITFKAVAEAFNLPYTPVEKYLK